MKVTSLKIKGYKNLNNEKLANLDLTNCEKYVALVGLNGSGKSNILEAISLIFLNLKRASSTPFEYQLEYEIDGNEVTVKNDTMTANGKKIAKNKGFEFLPTNIIASYSGEELRMWEDIYIESYSDFFQDVKQHNNEVPFLLYVNKYSWAFALISLLCAENKQAQGFIKDVLKIGDDVELKFIIDESYYGMYESNEALSLVKRISDIQKESKKGTIHINELKTLDIGQKSNADYTKKLFYYLFITGMPVRSEKVKAEKIIRKTELSFNGIDMPKLSEGEKKLILIYAITHLLSDENTLLLLDEPDAHIHIERKKDIIDIIANAPCFTIFTTHSPKILHSISDENIRIVRNTDVGVEIIFNNKLDALEEITNGEFSIVDATLAISTSKDILLVEGTNDFNYLKMAIKSLSPDYDNYGFHIINCGGADNVPAVLEQSLLAVLRTKQLCLCLFDHDNQGRVNKTKVEEIARTNKLGNVIAMFHPKIDGTEHNQSSDFFMEDYFPVDLYKNKILDNIKAKGNFKSLQQYHHPKSIIESNYLNYGKVDYLNFKAFLDKTIEMQNKFHQPKQPKLRAVEEKK
jgi:predicted ATP-dependent endonuclease of OLD family